MLWGGQDSVMNDVFISYSTDDRPRVEELAKTLESRSWSVWRDRRTSTEGMFCS